MFDRLLGRSRPRGSEDSNTGSVKSFKRSKAKLTNLGKLRKFDDEVEVPKMGFLATERRPALPTYQFLEYSLSGITPPKSFPLTVIDIIKTIEDNYNRARLILYETAYLNRTWFAVIQHGRIKLCDEARALDQVLREAERQLKPASSVRMRTIEGTHAHNRAVQSPGFKDALTSGNKTLRRLEKKLRDYVIDELMAGLIDKKDVDHAQLRLGFDKIHTEVRDVCAAVMREYAKEYKEDVSTD